MAFPQSVQEEALVACGRCCCICHKFCGTKMELHHIHQKADGGADTLDNCIPLCFDCHADMGKADPHHPKGKHYSEGELRKHRDNWFQKISQNQNTGNTNSITKADIKLFEKICSFFGDNTRYWLVESEFNVRPTRSFEELKELLHQERNPLYEFINPELEKNKATLFYALNEFIVKIATYTFLERVCGENCYATRKWLIDHGYLRRVEENRISDDEYEKLYERSTNEESELYDLAAKLWQAYCEFVRQCRIILSL